MHTETSQLQALETLPVYRNQDKISLRLASKKTTELLATLKNILADKKTPVIQFISAYNGEGAETIAFELAYRASMHAGKKILFIDAGGSLSEDMLKLHKPQVMALNSFMLSDTATQSPLGVFEGTSLYYARYQEGGSDRHLITPLTLQAFIEKLKSMFDMIVIYAGATVAKQATPTLSGLADGCVLVVEAESTRIPVIQSVRQSIEANGGRVLGVVLNNRRLHISRALYAWLFR
jgi:Mrp family chromosome partitioning ATPase